MSKMIRIITIENHKIQKNIVIIYKNNCNNLCNKEKIKQILDLHTGIQLYNNNSCISVCKLKIVVKALKSTFQILRRK